MSKSLRLHVRAPRVIFEHFDDEVVVVDLDTGNYYSLCEIAADIWALLVPGCGASEVVEALASRHPGDAAAIASQVPAFLEELCREGLITESAAEVDEPAGEARRCARLYAAPVLSRYVDMQELLLLDPIHDVDESGWPSRA